MERIQEAYLKSWFIKKMRKPLVIRGARQVGKSTLVRQFCKENQLSLYEINLEKYPELDAIFKTKQINRVMSALEDILEKKIKIDSKSLLFLDEIQVTPAALSCLRYFYEELPQLAVVAAGSLLEFILNDHEYSLPVGRIEYLHMGPMTFAEFLKAKKEDYFLEKMQSLKSLEHISDHLHEKGLNLLREFLFIGGMPSAISTYLHSGIDDVASIHSEILQTYQADFVKYAKKTHLSKIQKVFRYTFLNPCQKIKYTNISKDDLAKDLKANLELLRQARVVSKVIHSACQGIPLEASEDPAVFKMLALDVGLMNHLSGIKWSSFKAYGENEIITEGSIAEQFIGQHLLYQNNFYNEPHLNYWLREGKSHNAEVDFVVEEKGFLCAIEVKAGVAGKIRSLHQWMHDIKYKKKKALRFNLSVGQKEEVSQVFNEKALRYELTTLPLYTVDWWKKYV